MTTNIELDSFSGSLNEHSASNEHGEQTSPVEMQVAQANSTQQAAPAASEPVPVDVGGEAPVKPEVPAEAKAPPAAAPHEYVADASHVVRLPANVSIDNIKVDGHNLLLEQADGSVIVIKDGALNVPTFIIGDVEVPRVALLAALEASHVDVAFGADGSMSAGPGGSNSSAGGDFSVPPGGIGDGFDLSALLPPTALQFGLLERRELFPSIVDRQVSVTATSLLAPTEAASETGLDGGGSQSPGSEAPTDHETSGTGTISIVAPDGIGSIVINGVAVTGVGQQIPGQFGYLEIVSYNPSTGAIEYNYTVTESVTHPLQGNGFNPNDTVPDNFSITVTDVDGDSASTTFAVAIVDDVPTAVADTDSIAAGQFGPATGNVLVGGTDAADANSTDGVADTQGADGATVVGVQAGNTNADVDNAATLGVEIQGTYGKLTLQSDGSYSYVRDAGTAGGVNDVFTYTIKDGDGDTSHATLTISIGNSTPVITDLTPEANGGDVIVNEAALNVGTPGGPGSDPASTAETGAGTFTVSSPDGIHSLAIGGNAFITDGVFTAGSFTTALGNTLNVTAYNAATGEVTYTYTLVDNEAHAAVQGTNNLFENFTVTLTDQDLQSTNATLSVKIVDDVPTAHDEAPQSIAEGAPALTGTLDFVAGADGATVTHVNGTPLTFDPGTGYSQSIDIGAGTIQVKADGSYSFTPDASVDNSSGPVAVNATYTVTDGDLDTSTANIAFTITDGAAPVAGAPITLALDDQNLSDGSTPAGPDFASNAITFTPGSDAIASIAFGTDLSGLNAANLTWTRVSDTQVVGKDGAVTVVTLDLSVASNVATVTATLNNNYDAHPGINADDLVNLGHVGVVATDIDGTQATGTVNVTVSDDVPTATAEASQNVVEGATITGTLDFVAGADGATVTHIGATALVFGGDGYSQAIDIGDGSIKVMADGHYSFTADNPVVGTGAASAIYTVTDGDGDTATAGISFAVTDANTPTTGTAAASVDDDGLVGGNAASTTGDINANAGEVPLSASEATYNGTLGGSVGGDGAGANGFSFATLNGTAGTVGQENVTYSWNAGTNTLTATTTSGSRIGTALFTVHVTDPATGAYTVALLDNVLQAQGPNNENNATVNLGYVITDADGSTAPGTLTVTFNDDAPTLGAFMPGTIPNEVGSVNGLFDFAAGADGTNHFNITGPVIAGVSYSTTVQADGTTVLLAETSTGTDIYSLTVHSDGHYTFALITPDAATTVTQTLTGLSPGGPTPFLETPDGLIEFTGSGSGVNSSTQGFGVADQFVEKGENFTMEFHTSATAGNDAPTLNPKFIGSLDFAASGNSSGSVSWIATNSGTGQTDSGTATVTNGHLVIDPSIDFNLISITGDPGSKIRLSAVDISQTILPSDTTLHFQLSAVDGDGDVSATQSLDIHQVAASSGGSFTLPGFAGTVNDVIAGSTHIDTISGGAGTDIVDYTGSVAAVSIHLADDGSASGAPATFTNPAAGTIGGGDAMGDTLTNIEGLIGGSGNDYLFGNIGDNYLAGGFGNDTLNGGGGNDTLVGGAGLNTMIGGGGSDTFVIDHSALAEINMVDVIADFSAAQDLLDLSDVFGSLGGGGPTTDNQAAALVDITFSGGAAHVFVDNNGTAAGGNMVEVASLSGVGAGSVINILYDHSATTHSETVA